MEASQDRPATDKPRRMGCWIAGIGVALLFLVFGCAIVVGFLAVLAEKVETDIGGEGALVEKKVEGNGPNKILLLSLRGVITDEPRGRFPFKRPGLLNTVKKQLRKAEADKSIKAILLQIDSPGGGITASDILYRRFHDFKKKTGRKIVVCMGDLAASGGYYVAAAADYIVAHPTTITGSIGVIMPLMNFSTLADRLGIESTPIKSGPMKDVGSPLRKMKPEERKMLDAIIKEMYTRFVRIVATGRNLRMEDVRKLADGRIYTGQQALQLHLVDEVGYFEDAVAAAKRLCKLKEATLIRYRRPVTFASMFDAALSAFATNRVVEVNLGRPLSHRETLPAYLWNPGRTE